jgi:hypothetical protein
MLLTFFAIKLPGPAPRCTLTSYQRHRDRIMLCEDLLSSLHLLSPALVKLIILHFTSSQAALITYVFILVIFIQLHI